MVRLKEKYYELSGGKIAHFNSNLVRLKVWFVVNYRIFQPVFQFQFGAIKRLEFDFPDAFFTYFNSNLVRLKEGLTGISEAIDRNFNSNLVRLKGKGGCSDSNCWNHFNSNLVRLKAIFPMYVPRILLHFNSNLVRLKEYINSLVKGTGSIFQFQFGAIKSFQLYVITNLIY